MFGYSYINACVSAYQLATEQFGQEEAAFAKAVAAAPAEERDKMIAERKERKERARREAIEERRHQELCAAIRKSGFWP